MSFSDFFSIMSAIGSSISILVVAVLCTKIMKLEDDIRKNKKDSTTTLKNKPLSADLQKLYSTIDTKSVSDEIDNWIAGYLSDYIARNITLQGVEYVKAADTQKMLKEVSYNIISKMSNLYRWYISLLVNIDNDDNLIDFINARLSLQIIAFTSKFNQTK